MRILGLTVGRNEVDRYLMPMLMHMRDVVDSHFFYDDLSEDDTAAVAAWGGCMVVQRPENEASFVQAEGAFRGQAWQAFERTMSPKVGDWVLVIDCDEALVSNTENDVAFELRHVILWSDKTSIELSIPEVFGFTNDGVPRVRTDGLWGTISAPRLFRYHTDGQYYMGGAGEFGVPAVPSYVMAASRGQTDRISLMHYGYADDRDKLDKFARYNARPGHNNQHVQSILGPFHLKTWEGQLAEGMRRARKR
jgi:hypothetical protein